MTDQEIRCAILKYVYEKNRAGEKARAVLSWICSEYGVYSEKERERVQSIITSLEKGGSLKSETYGKVASATDKKITEKGITEYKEKCTRSKQA